MPFAVPDAWQLEATVAHRSLIERDASGARLLRESGPLGGVRITAPLRGAPLGRLDVTGSVIHGRLDYDGRTQAGAPLATTSAHNEVEAGLRWRPMPRAQAWGDAFIGVDALWFRRDIAATAAAAGLRETSTLWLGGAGWTGPQWVVASVPVSLHAGWRTSIDHRLRVDYGGLFDPSAQRGGRRSELSVGAAAAFADNWSLALDWQHTRQSASRVSPLFRSGAVAGTVYQPRIAIDDVGLTLSRRF